MRIYEGCCKERTYQIYLSSREILENLIWCDRWPSYRKVEVAKSYVLYRFIDLNYKMKACEGPLWLEIKTGETGLSWRSELDWGTNDEQWQEELELEV